MLLAPLHFRFAISVCFQSLYNFSCHVFSIDSNILIYFNIFVHFYSFFSIARRAIVKMNEANKSLLLSLLLFSLLLLSLLLLLLLLNEKQNFMEKFKVFDFSKCT